MVENGGWRGMNNLSYIFRTQVNWQMALVQGSSFGVICYKGGYAGKWVAILDTVSGLWALLNLDISNLVQFDNPAYTILYDYYFRVNQFN